jgi:hypothetical protein
MTDACKKHVRKNKKKKKTNAHTYYVMKHVPKPCKNQKKQKFRHASVIRTDACQKHIRKKKKKKNIHTYYKRKCVQNACNNQEKQICGHTPVVMTGAHRKHLRKKKMPIPIM